MILSVKNCFLFLVFFLILFLMVFVILFWRKESVEVLILVWKYLMRFFLLICIIVLIKVVNVSYILVGSGIFVCVYF